MKRMFWFTHGKRTVYTVASNEEFAKQKFQARWGYWPDDPVYTQFVDKTKEPKR